MNFDKYSSIALLILTGALAGIGVLTLTPLFPYGIEFKFDTKQEQVVK